MRGLFWFREDLRLHDNPALARMAEHCDELILLYCFDDRQLRPGRFHSKGIAAPRMGFLTESLADLSNSIAQRNQRLIIRRGDPAEVVTQLIRRYSVDCLGTTVLPAPQERRALKTIQARFPHLQVVQGWAHTLFTPQQLPFPRAEFPEHFVQFRTLMQPVQPDPPESSPEILPSPPMIVRTEECDPLPVMPSPYRHDWVPPQWIGFSGGEQAALRQLSYYLWERHLVRRYDDTRNGLMGWDFSSKLGPWLAMGCLSVRQVWQALTSYENYLGACDSTRRLRRELLWREYLQWLLFKHGERAFEPSGVKGESRLLGFYPEAFSAWTRGTTGIPIVDACMRELKNTGWLSRRGRQIAACFLVNELGMDWRFGAAWFEQQLIDFDAAINWGNWSYFARPETQHQPLDNVLKQAYQYDPEAEYVSLWLPELQELPPEQRHTPFWSRKAADFRYPIVDVSPWRKAL